MSRHFLLIALGVIASLSLAACKKETAADAPADISATTVETTAQTEDAPAQPARPYIARGNEPGWIVTLNDGQMDIVANYGEDRLTLPILSERLTDTQRIVTGRIAGADNTPESNVILSILYKQCFDNMSGEPFAHTTFLILDGQIYQGCGQSMIRDTTWQLPPTDTAQGHATQDETPFTLNFTSGGEIIGTTGCALYTASYTLEDEGIRILQAEDSLIESCEPDGINARERSFLDHLKRASHATINESGAMVLSDPHGLSLLLQQQSAR